MVFLLRCLGAFFAIVLLGNGAAPADKVAKPAGRADRGFVLRAENVTATDGEPALLKLTLVYIGDKHLRIDYPVDGVCQPGNGRPPWVWIYAPDSWKDRQEAFRDAFPTQDNSLHSTAVTLKRGDKFEATIPLHWRFRKLPIGRSSIKVTWPVYGDTFAPNWSSHPLATPAVTVPVVIDPQLVRKEPHNSDTPHPRTLATEIRSTASR